MEADLGAFVLGCSRSRVVQLTRLGSLGALSRLLRWRTVLEGLDDDTRGLRHFDTSQSARPTSSRHITPISYRTTTPLAFNSTGLSIPPSVYTSIGDSDISSPSSKCKRQSVTRPRCSTLVEVIAPFTMMVGIRIRISNSARLIVWRSVQVLSTALFVQEVFIASPAIRFNVSRPNVEPSPDATTSPPHSPTGLAHDADD